MSFVTYTPFYSFAVVCRESNILDQVDSRAFGWFCCDIKQRTLLLRVTRHIYMGIENEKGFKQHWETVHLVDDDMELNCEEVIRQK